MSKWLIETDELAQQMVSGSQADRTIVDCSWYLPDAGKHAIDDFRQGHIPGAQFLDLTEISDPISDYVNMLPEAALFAEVVGKLGIGSQTEVIIYDAGYVSARIWWMFRTFGHDNVRILNGGLRKWKAEDRDLETGDANPVSSKPFPAKVTEGRVASISDVRAVIENGQTPLIDARTAARFDGHEGSGYPGVASGFMPGAINTPWQLFFEPAPSHRFVSPQKAKEIFDERGVDTSGEIITTCGSGVTASILGFMLEATGHSNWRLYDGSWHEWGQQEDTPKEIKPL